MIMVQSLLFSRGGMVEREVSTQDPEPTAEGCFICSFWSLISPWAAVKGTGIGTCGTLTVRAEGTDGTGAGLQVLGLGGSGVHGFYLMLSELPVCCFLICYQAVSSSPLSYLLSQAAWQGYGPSLQLMTTQLLFSPVLGSWLNSSERKRDKGCWPWLMSSTWVPTSDLTAMAWRDVVT